MQQMQYQQAGGYIISPHPAMMQPGQPMVNIIPFSFFLLKIYMLSYYYGFDNGGHEGVYDFQTDF